MSSRSRCATCTSPHRDEAEGAVLGGATVRGTARRYGVTESSLRRHVAGHFVADLARPVEDEDTLRVGSLVARLVGMVTDAEDVRSEAMDAGQHRTALHAIAAETALINLLMDRLKITDLSIADDLRESRDLVAGVAAVVYATPEFGDRLAAALQARSSHSLAGHIAGPSRGRAAAADSAASTGPALAVLAAVPGPAAPATLTTANGSSHQ